MPAKLIILILWCSAVHTGDFLHYCLFFSVPAPLESLSLIWGLSCQSRTVKYYGGRDCTIICMVECLFCKKFVVVHVFRSLTLGTLFVNGLMFSSHSLQQSSSVIHFCDLVKVALVRPISFVKIKLSRAYRLWRSYAPSGVACSAVDIILLSMASANFSVLACQEIWQFCVTLSYFGDSCFMKFYAHATWNGVYSILCY